MMKKKKSASALISDLKRKTRKAYSSEDKIRIIIEDIHLVLLFVVFMLTTTLHIYLYFLTK